MALDFLPKVLFFTVLFSSAIPLMPSFNFANYQYTILSNLFAIINLLILLIPLLLIQYGLSSANDNNIIEHFFTTPLKYRTIVFAELLALNSIMSIIILVLVSIDSLILCFKEDQFRILVFPVITFFLLLILFLVKFFTGTRRERTIYKYILFAFICLILSVLISLFSMGNSIVEWVGWSDYLTLSISTLLLSFVYTPIVFTVFTFFRNTTAILFILTYFVLLFNSVTLNLPFPFNLFDFFFIEYNEFGLLLNSSILPFNLVLGVLMNLLAVILICFKQRISSLKKIW